MLDTYFINANLAFQQLYDHILQNGRVKKGTRYIRNVVFTMLSPWENSIKVEWRKWNPNYAQLEWEWYLTGNRSPQMVEKKAKLWEQMKDDSGYVNSNYGSWWIRNNQLYRVIEMLKRDNDTRRAILTHYSPDEVQNYGKDTPCNVVLNFYIDEDKVHLTIFARSIDLVYGFCNDQYCFSKLLMEVTQQMNNSVPPWQHTVSTEGNKVETKMKYGCGTMTYMITDLHIYEKHWNMKNKFYGIEKLF